MGSLTLEWDRLHRQSREHICEMSGYSVSLAQQSAAEIEPWLREDVAVSFRAASHGKLRLIWVAAS